jgi:hypothetical protein
MVAILFMVQLARDPLKAASPSLGRAYLRL